MQVVPVNNLHHTNNQNIRHKYPAFGNLIPEEKYLNRLVSRASDAEFNCVAALCEKPINLKILLKYNEVETERKNLLDKYFGFMPKEEVNNLTVTIGARDFYKKEEEYLAPATLTANLPNVDTFSKKINYKRTVMSIMDRPDCYTPVPEDKAWIPTNEIFNVLADKINENFEIFKFLYNNFLK